MDTLYEQSSSFLRVKSRFANCERDAKLSKFRWKINEFALEISMMDLRKIIWIKKKNQTRRIAETNFTKIKLFYCVYYVAEIAENLILSFFSYYFYKTDR